MIHLRSLWQYWEQWEQWLCLGVGHVSGLGLNKQAAGCKTLLGQHLAKITKRKQPQRFCTKHTSALQYLQYHCRIATITFEFSHHCNCMDSTEAVSSSCTTLQNRYNYITFHWGAHWWLQHSFPTTAIVLKLYCIKLYGLQCSAVNAPNRSGGTFGCYWWSPLCIGPCPQPAHLSVGKTLWWEVGGRGKEKGSRRGKGGGGGK